jgi:hypothetical protein
LRPAGILGSFGLTEAGEECPRLNAVIPSRQAQRPVVIPTLGRCHIRRSALDPVGEDDHAGIAERAPPGALSQHMPKFRHHHIGAMFLDQPGGWYCPALPHFAQATRTIGKSHSPRLHWAC